MPKPTLAQLVLKKPSQSYSHGDNAFYSIATDPERRRRTQSEYGGSDTASIRSFSGFSDVGSIRSSASFKKSPKRRYAASVQSWAASVEQDEQPSRTYGNYLNGGRSNSLRTRSELDILKETNLMHARKTSTSSSAASTSPVKRMSSSAKKSSTIHPDLPVNATAIVQAAQTSPSLPSTSGASTPSAPASPSKFSSDSPSRVATQDSQRPSKIRALAKVQEEEEPSVSPPMRKIPLPVAHDAKPSRVYATSPPQNVALSPKQNETLPSHPQGVPIAIAKVPVANSPDKQAEKPAGQQQIHAIRSSLIPQEVAQLMYLVSLDLAVSQSYSVQGQMRSSVANPSIVLRCSRDEWKSHTDLLCSSNALQDGLYEFSTRLEATARDKLALAIRMSSGDTEIWDSNKGQNYVIVLPPLLTPPSALQTHDTQPLETPPIQMSTPTIVHQPPTPLHGQQLHQDSVSKKGHTSEASIDDSSSFYSTHSQETHFTPLTTPPSSEVSSQLKTNGIPPIVAQSTLVNPMQRIPSNSSSGSSDGKAARPPASIDYPATMIVPSAPVRTSTASIRQQVAVASLEKAKADAMLSLPVSTVQAATSEPAQTTSRPSSIKSASSRNAQNEPFTWKKPTSAPVAFTPSSQATMPKDDVATLGQVYDPADYRAATQVTHQRSFERKLEVPMAQIAHARSKSSYAGSVSSHSSTNLSVPQGYRSSSVRRNAVKADWSSESVNHPSATMCAIALARNAHTPSLRSSRSKMFPSKKEKEEAEFLSSRPRTWSDVKYIESAEPPTRIKTHELLVQVYATGLDFWDTARVDTLIKRGDGYGFIPGRSFVGKVIQTGVEVKLKVGDVVYGLSDLGRSGALAELLVVDRKCVALAPNAALTLEQLAVVPLAGVPALTAVSTICESLQKGARVLVLNGDAGAGYLATQLFRLLRPDNDLYIAVQVPEATLNAEGFTGEGQADDVFRDDPLVAFNRIHESSFDVVLDTVGGRRIYEGARRILTHDGYFVSLVGDELGPPTVKKSWQSGLRSLRRAFLKKDKKSISYWLPMLSETDYRDALNRLKELVEEKGLSPVVRQVFRFEHGSEAFHSRYLAGGTVVKILEA